MAWYHLRIALRLTGNGTPFDVLPDLIQESLAGRSAEERSIQEVLIDKGSQTYHAYDGIPFYDMQDGWDDMSDEAIELGYGDGEEALTEWRQEIADDNTRLGYIQWIKQKLQEKKEELE